ncbi:YjjG family noncanonical pyrimidine nucleotidase [Candidatus Bipolaricaulota bacterium]|nr:YjjG family noncanonical pyrimidine nucleotidase [Candidatus Bipolaricaulota bacterium]
MSRTGRYRWIFLDADGTLFDYSAAESGALAATLAEEGVFARSEHIDAYRAVNAALWRRFERGEVSQATLRTLRFSQFSERFGLELDAVAFGSRYLGHLAQCAELIDGAESVVRFLHGRAGLLLLTNGISEVQRSRLALSPLHGLLDHVVISGEVGAAKPDPRMFDVAFECAGNPTRSSVLMVGDSLSSDIRGGALYGIDTCWFNPMREPNSMELVPTFEIQSLRELAAIGVMTRADDDPEQVFDPDCV